MFRRLFAPHHRRPRPLRPSLRVYDPSQAKLEAESVKACIVKFNDSDDPVSESAPAHQGATVQPGQGASVGAVDRLLQAPDVRGLSPASRPIQRGDQVGRAAGTKGSTDPAVADELLAKIDEISEIFWATKK